MKIEQTTHKSLVIILWIIMSMLSLLVVFIKQINIGEPQVTILSGTLISGISVLVIIFFISHRQYNKELYNYLDRDHGTDVGSTIEMLMHKKTPYKTLVVLKTLQKLNNEIFLSEFILGLRKHEEIIRLNIGPHTNTLIERATEISLKKLEESTRRFEIQNGSKSSELLTLISHDVLTAIASVYPEIDNSKGLLSANAVEEILSNMLDRINSQHRLWILRELAFSKDGRCDIEMVEYRRIFLWKGLFMKYDYTTTH